MKNKVSTMMNLIIAAAWWLFLGRLNSNMGIALDNNLPVYEVIGSRGMMSWMQILFILGFIQVIVCFIMVVDTF